MNLKKKIRENEEKYVKPYVDSAMEIEFINNSGFQTFDKQRNKIKLYGYQEEFLVNLHTTKVNFVLKCRMCGITTAWLLHVIHVLSKYRGSFETAPTFMYVTTSNECAKYAKDMMKFYIETGMCGDLSLYSLCNKHVIFTCERSCRDKMCGTIISEVLFDECNFFENYMDILDCLMGAGVKNVTLSTSIKDDGDKEKFNKGVGTILEKMKNCDSVRYTEVHWWECPVFNKNLVWKKIEVEPTIDKEGNVEYNKERWEQKIKDGWMPTSAEFEYISSLLGDNSNELLN